MTFAAEEVERVWEEEEEEREISLGLVDWTHHRGAKKKKKNILSGQEKNRQEKREEKYWTEIRCRSLFNAQANLCIH